MYDGKLTGRLSAQQQLSGKLAELNNISGILYLPQSIIDDSGSKDYDLLNNKPKINNHELRSGENSLEEIGIALSSITAINQLFT